jgi:hypothetical protein
MSEFGELRNPNLEQNSRVRQNSHRQINLTKAGYELQKKVA